jgi:SAM-dependent methyltransferase
MANHPSPPNEVSAQLEAEGPSWAERAPFGELNAVISPYADERWNCYLHAIELFGAKTALKLHRHRGRKKGVLVDFGCGTGRFLRFFGERGYRVVGTEITAQMLSEARKFGLPEGTVLHLTNGVSIPLPDQSVDLVWVCGVLKFGLFAPGALCRGGPRPFTNEPTTPLYQEIAEEMYRVLKLGGFVVNVEMYVDAPPEVFLRDFEQVGFHTRQVRVLHRYNDLADRIVNSRRFPTRFAVLLGELSAAYRSLFDDPRRPGSNLCDYLFVWHKRNG